MGKANETDLYPPVKAHFEAQGYVVKSEIGAVDVMAVRGGEDPVLIELKLGFSLALFHQCVARQSISDDVYACVERVPGRRFRQALKNNLKLARRLGLGVMTVRLKDDLIEVHCDPGPFTPRKSAKKRDDLLGEFTRRAGDPNAGGQMRSGLVTVYRQDATKIAVFLYEAGAGKGADVARATGVERATKMMADNHYGWFERIDTGVYGLTPLGAEAAMKVGAVLGG